MEYKKRIQIRTDFHKRLVYRLLHSSVEYCLILEMFC